MIKLTLDTNCVINLLDFEAQTPTSVDELSEIIRYALDGDANISVTTRVEDDFAKDKDEDRKKEMIRKLKMFPVIGTTFRLDVSRLDSGDFATGDFHKKLAKEIQALVFPGLDKDSSHYGNKINDIDHLLGHATHKRDIFVTDDIEILRRADKLKESLNIVAMSPSQCLEYLDLRGKKDVLVQQFFEKLSGLKDLLDEVADNGITLESELKYSEMRCWLMKKFPKLHDGLLAFRHRMRSIPIGGQRIFDKSEIINLQRIQKNFEDLFVERELLSKTEALWNTGSHPYIEYHHTPYEKKELTAKKFGQPMDLLTSYVGYLEND